MKLRVIAIFAVLMVAANIAMLLLAPRFGWELGTVFSSYKFVESHRFEGNTVDTYIDYTTSGEESVRLRIQAPSRFSRDFYIWHNDETASVKINIDGGVSGSVPWQTGSKLDYVLSEIIWKDSSGIFFYRYLIVALAAVLYTECLVKSARARTVKGQRAYVVAAVVLFVAAGLVAMRVVI